MGQSYTGRRRSSRPPVVCRGSGLGQVSHFSASPAASPRVYRATMSPCFHRPWRCTAALGAPAATILRVIPIRPLCPVNPSPKPAAFAAARTRLAEASLVNSNTGAVSSMSLGWIFLTSTWGIGASLWAPTTKRRNDELVESRPALGLVSLTSPGAGLSLRLLGAGVVVRCFLV